ncbi:MerR family transcriptional regulator [Dehalobacterium formicoaceticum]|uniref:MerR family transcriptional regulator n=1 Tax=Dehalobacterium formicoaceticum TaxID=51515 RepID=A0ABT1Y540_9FIRM|nr:MerR family transcriptional regulator [Dehalobacterium formicoaceticum]MCR6545982.1 MerR family transcriptional regulator [Dehalobacterium formicoaceticum]
MLYTVGEMAKKLNVAPSTLRYYDKEGLLPFVERSGGGIRMFKDEDFEWLSTIECLKKAGMSIKDIKFFIDWCIEGDSTIEQRLTLIDKQRESVLNQIKQMQETLNMLEYKHWYYETARKAGTCAVHAAMEEKDIPKEFRSAREKSKGLTNTKK